MSAFDERFNMYGRAGQGFGNILQVLAQMAERKRMEEQEAQLQSQAQGLFQPGTGTRVDTDLLNKPMQPTFTGQQPSYDMFRAAQLANSNPFVAQDLKRMGDATIPLSEGQERVNTITGQKYGNPKAPKQEKFSSGFGDFFRANAQKYADNPNGLSQAYADYQEQTMNQFTAKEGVKAQNRPQRGGKVLTSFTADDGYKTIVYENPDGSIKHIKSNERVKETESASSKKQNALFTSLSDLTDRIEQSVKEEYLGGITSGLAGKGAGGVLGSIREATGYIDDEEVVFRANVASISDQLLRLRSGAQINEQEYKRLLKEVPSVDQPKNVFVARLRGFKSRLNDILKSKSSNATDQTGKKDQPRFEILEVK